MRASLLMAEGITCASEQLDLLRVPALDWFACLRAKDCLVSIAMPILCSWAQASLKRVTCRDRVQATGVEWQFMSQWKLALPREAWQPDKAKECHLAIVKK